MAGGGEAPTRFNTTRGAPECSPRRCVQSDASGGRLSGYGAISTFTFRKVMFSAERLAFRSHSPMPSKLELVAPVTGGPYSTEIAVTDRDESLTARVTMSKVAIGALGQGFTQVLR